MAKMYSLSMFIFELKILVSFALLLILWYKLRFIDALIKYLVVLDIKRVAKLPVTIENVVFSVSGYCILENVRVHRPPPEVDDRWQVDTMVSASCIYIEFPLLISLWFQLMSAQQLMVYDSIQVTGRKKSYYYGTSSL